MPVLAWIRYFFLHILLIYFLSLIYQVQLDHWIAAKSADHYYGRTMGSLCISYWQKACIIPRNSPIVFIFSKDLKVCDRNGKNARFYLPGEHSVTKWGINVKTFVFIQNYRWEIYKTVITICSIKQTFALSFIYWKQCAGILFQSEL